MNKIGLQRAGVLNASALFYQTSEPDVTDTSNVPVKYAGKQVSIKGYCNKVQMLYRNTEIARYTRCYDRGKTFYRLEHYIDLIEQRPRSVFNAKPVKSNISLELQQLGQ